MLNAAKSELADLQMEHQREMEGLLDSVRQLRSELLLQLLIIGQFDLCFSWFTCNFHCSGSSRDTYVTYSIKCIERIKILEKHESKYSNGIRKHYNQNAFSNVLAQNVIISWKQASNLSIQTQI